MAKPPLPRRIPLRMCTGCGEMKPKRELVRVVKNADGQVALDKTGKLPGRGAYVCNSADCLRKARKARRLERAFAMKMPDALYDALEEAMTADE